MRTAGDIGLSETGVISRNSLVRDDRYFIFDVLQSRPAERQRSEGTDLRRNTIGRVTANRSTDDRDAAFRFRRLRVRERRDHRIEKRERDEDSTRATQKRPS